MVEFAFLSGHIGAVSVENIYGCYFFTQYFDILDMSAKLMTISVVTINIIAAMMVT